MKNLITLFLLILFLSGCSTQFIQVFETKPINTNQINDSYVYENDTIKITYDFWEDKGVMAFSIYNKLDKPIYIDWKKSSFIYNNKKLDYWIDEQTTNASSYYGGYTYKIPKTPLSVGEGVQNTSAITTKPERITFIPPKSYISQTKFYLLPVAFFKIDRQKMTKSVLPRNDNPKKETTVYEQDFDLLNSPLNFRNYISYSFSENDKDFYFIDNGFYLISAKEMDYRNFRGEQIGRDRSGILIYGNSRFKYPNSFYIKINPDNAVESDSYHYQSSSNKKHNIH